MPSVTGGIVSDVPRSGCAATISMGTKAMSAGRVQSPSERKRLRYKTCARARINRIFIGSEGCRLKPTGVAIQRRALFKSMPMNGTMASNPRPMQYSKKALRRNHIGRRYRPARNAGIAITIKRKCLMNGLPADTSARPKSKLASNAARTNRMPVPSNTAASPKISQSNRAHEISGSNICQLRGERADVERNS